MLYVLRGVLRLKVFSLQALLLYLLCSVYLFLMFSPPLNTQTPFCPRIKTGRVAMAAAGGAPRPVDCARLVRGDVTELRRAARWNQCRRADVVSDWAFPARTADCKTYLRGWGPWRDPGMSIAYRWLRNTGSPDVEQVERLLRAIFRPRHVICLHVDAFAPAVTHRGVTSLARCLNSTGRVVVAPPVYVRWAEDPVLQAELSCMRLLARQPGWSYYINLTGKEFPLRTQEEIARILTAYSGGNDIDGHPHRRPRHWTDWVWRSEAWQTGTRKTPAPHGFVVNKGSAHIVASRKFVDYVLHDNRSLDLREWVRDIRAPDEHYFNTLNHNPQLKVPGAFTKHPGTKPFMARLKVWMNGTNVCHGTWVRHVCNLGVGDLPRLLKAPQLFVNKLSLQLHPLAFQCAEQWLRQHGSGTPGFNLDTYRRLPWVSSHV